MTCLSIHNLPLSVAVAAAEAMNHGAVQPVYIFGKKIPSFMLDVKTVSIAIQQDMRKAGFRDVPADPEHDDTWMVWTPEEYRSIYDHPSNCDCMECRDPCCCGDDARRHGGDHMFVSAYWRWKESIDE